MGDVSRRYLGSKQEIIIIRTNVASKGKQLLQNQITDTAKLLVRNGKSLAFLLYPFILVNSLLILEGILIMHSRYSS